MAVTIRRTLLHVQTTHEEGGKTVDDPTLLVAALAIVRNPWFGRGWVEDLRPEIREHGPVLGKTLTDMILSVCGDRVEGYGKASLVGMGGEVEHAQALFVEAALLDRFQPVAQVELALGAIHDAVEIESGKRLPFTLQKREHLLQGSQGFLGAGH